LSCDMSRMTRVIATTAFEEEAEELVAELRDGARNLS
ncbi:hypothetical protein Tco_0518767, partial [Tanacetum coccineum]